MIVFLGGRSLRRAVLGLVGCVLMHAAAGPGLADRYRFECATCHGADGSARLGATRLPGRVLADAAWMAKQQDGDLARAIEQGKGAMPSFKGKLAPEDISRMVKEQIRPLARPVKRARRK